MPSPLNPQQRLDESIAIYRALIAKNPNVANLHLCLGRALMEKNLAADAIVCFQRVIALDPACSEAYGRLGHLLVQQYRLYDGIAALRRAVELMPGNSRLPFYLFQAYSKAGMLNEAIACLKQSIALNPDVVETHASLLGTLLYSPHYYLKDILADRLALGERMEAHWRSKWHKTQKKIDPKKRLRIGFVSGDLGAHPVGFFLESVLCELRELDRSDIFIYTQGNAAGGITDRIRSAAHSWVPIFTLSDDALEKRIRDDKIDILIDLSGHTAFNRLSVFARKPAPVQVTWLGDCATTGLSAIDYILCDSYGVRDGEEGFYSEKPWFLPSTRLCFTPPAGKISINTLPALEVGYITFGCFNNLIKMTDQVVALWGRILNRVPASRLMLKSLAFYDPKVRNDVIMRFASHGVDQERLLLTLGKNREEYFADYNFVDIALDPFPFTGGTTSIDGVWMGVPFITLCGDTMGSRQGEGILHNLNMEDWIAADEEAYIELAVKKSQDLLSLEKVRNGLRDGLESSSLCDAKFFARNLEDAFKQMWEVHSKNTSDL